MDRYVPIWSENRRPLDSRRVGAFLVDTALLALLIFPLSALFGEMNGGAWLTFLGLSLTYYFVCETRSGQTIGKRMFDLRVVRIADAGPAPAAAIAARTVLRLIESSLLGLIVLILSRGRRQRLGDLAAKTAVVRASARSYTPARRSPLVTIYPAVWLGAVAALILATGHGGDPELAAVDRACSDGWHTLESLSPQDRRDHWWEVRVAMLNRIGSMKVRSAKARAAAARVVELGTAEWNFARQVSGTPAHGAYPFKVADMIEADHNELVQLGLHHC